VAGVVGVEGEMADGVDCSCAACAAGLRPFTVAHFRGWARELVLDSWLLPESGGPWRTAGARAHQGGCGCPLRGWGTS